MMDAATSAAFGDAIRGALVAASIMAVVTSVVVSVGLSSAIAGPVTRLASAARRVAHGHYAERVPEAGEGEISELATSFNAMAGSLEATEQRRLQLVGDVAHELRTPLATIDGYLEGLEDGVITAGSDTWRLLRGETARLTRLVNELQDLWRAEAGQLPLEIASVDASEVVRQVVERFGPGTLARRLVIAVDLPQRLPVRADRDRLAQILDNFLSNALRYTADGTTVTITARSGPGRVAVAVRDEGPGLTAEQRAAVFERFYRVDAARSRALGGSGIGLAIARALAEAMHGRVWAESAGPGTGATFMVELPST
jgi:two-component system, OmpR family, sensor histidine kinase BaeS